METLQMFGIAVLALFLLMLVSFASFYLFKVLKILSDKYLSEKISLRVKDALDKLHLVVKTVVDANLDLYQVELAKAMVDGKLEQKELEAIALKMADKTMGMISPDVETLKKFVVGEGLADFVLNLVKGYIKDTIFKKVSAKIDPFVSNLRPDPLPLANGVSQQPK